MERPAIELEHRKAVRVSVTKSGPPISNPPNQAKLIFQNVSANYIVTGTELFLGIFMLPFNVAHLGQSAYGLAFRHIKDDYGFFGVLKSGGFRILEVHHTGVYQLVQSDSAAFDARPGAANRIGVAGVGPDFVFLINDQVVGQISADLTPGQIGLGIDALAKADTAQVDFSELQINAP